MVRSAIFETGVEVFLAALQAGHSIWKTDFYEILFANLLASECGEEIHEIPFMIPLFHAHILADSKDVFCVSRVGILNNMKSKIIASTLLGIGFLIGASALSALAVWSGAPCTPTTCPTNIDGCNAPIHVGAVGQNKFGSLSTLGLGVIGDFKFLPSVDPSKRPTIGQVLMVDDSDLANGKVKWGSVSGGSSGGFGVRNDRTKDGVVDTTPAWSTVYHAQTDGFVTAWFLYGSHWPLLQGFSDSNSNPTTLIVEEDGGDDGGGRASVTFPVRKGDYWKVTYNYDGVTRVIYAGGISWMPMGN